MFSSIEQAISYIKNKIEQFYSDGASLVNQQSDAQALMQILSERGESTVDASVILDQINRRINSWRSLENLVKPFADYWNVQTFGLGAIPLLPIALLASAITVAISLYNWFTGPSDFRRSLELIAEEKLTPQDIQRVGLSTSMFAGVNQTLVFILLGIGGFLLLTARR